jgi:hypothetical protein
MCCRIVQYGVTCAKAISIVDGAARDFVAGSGESRLLARESISAVGFAGIP